MNDNLEKFLKFFRRNNATKHEPNNNPENVLVFSSDREILALDTDETVKKITERHSEVKGLCSHTRQDLVKKGILSK